MGRPMVLDLFCCRGGATRGYQDAGFYVVGVDHVDQPGYCGDDFVRADAIKFARAHGHKRAHPARAADLPPLPLDRLQRRPGPDRRRHLPQARG